MNNLSSADNNFKKKNTDNIFREYKKIDDNYLATNNFYVSDENNCDRLEFKSFDIKNLYQTNIVEKISLYENEQNIYILIKNINNNTVKEYIDLIVISNISFSLDEININKINLINKFISCDEIINEHLFVDLYYNENFSKKINLELPKKYNNKKIILEDIDINKKYLFKISFNELIRNFNEEKNLSYL